VKMLNVVTPDQIDSGLWSEFVMNHPEGTIFQTPEMYQVYKSSEGFEPVAFFVTQDNAIKGMVLATLQSENNIFLKSLTSRSLIWGAPLIKLDIDSKMVFLNLFKKYNQIVGHRVLYTQVRNISDLSNYKNLFYRVGFNYEEHLNYIINLKKGKEVIWRSMNKKRRNSIRKGKNSGILIEKVRNLDDLKKTYEVLAEVYKTIRPLESYSLFSNSFSLLNSKGMIQCLNANYNGKIIATVCLLRYKGRIFNWYAGGRREYLCYNPNDLLMWHAIKEGIRDNFDIFDFGGAGKPNEDYGVRDFKKKFGGKEVSFGRFEKSHKPLIHSGFFSLFDLYRKYAFRIL